MSLAVMLSRTPFRRLFPVRRSASLVAVDVASGAVRAIHVRRDRDDLVLDGYRVVRLGEAAERSLEEAAREVLELRLDDEPVAVSVTSASTAIRKVELPPMTSQELHQALPWEARRHIAGLADDAVVGAQVLSNGGGDAPMEIVLIAFPREPYARIGALWDALGVDPEFIDVGQLATMNALFPRGPLAGPESAALLDLGSSEASFSIFSRSNLLLFRDLSPRLARLDGLLARKFSLEPRDVQAFKLGGKLPGGKLPPPGKVEEALADLVNELAEDLRSGLVYFENHTGGSLERVHLAGANAAFFDRHGIAEAIATQSGVPVERFNPFHGFRLGLIDEIGLKAVSSELCAAAGVALRYFATT